MLLGLLGLITVLRKVYWWVCLWKKLNRWIFGKVTSKKVVVSCTFFVFSSVEAKRTKCTSNHAGWTVCGASVMSANQPRFAKHSTLQTITGHFYNARTHTHTSFNGPLPGTAQVSRYQKGKTNLDFTEARDSEWQWHQLDHSKSAPRSRSCQHLTTQFFTDRMPFLPPNQQRQSTEGTKDISITP